MTHLDDLPKRTSEHIGETENKQAVRNLFTDPRFLIRKEEENDYGIDFEMEVLLPVNDSDANATNIRFHLQLKASGKESNSDDSYSYSVDRTNLNYLLNSPRSLYVFYARASKKCYYRWAEDVLVECEKQGSDWRTQDTITIRFKEILDATSCLSIHQRMLDESPKERDLRLSLRKQGTYLYGQFNYDASTREITDIDEILRLLNEHGLAICAGGNAAFVLHLIEKVPASALSPSGKLVKAYASYLLSKHGMAYESLNSCNSDDLPNDDDRALHSYLRAALRRSLGLTDYIEFCSEMKSIETKYRQTVSAIYARLENLRTNGIVAKDDGSLIQVSAVVSELKGRGHNWLPIYYQALFVELELKFYRLQNRFREQVFNFRIQEKLGVSAITSAKREIEAKNLVEDNRVWLQDFERIMQDCSKSGVHVIVAEGLLTFCSCMIQETVLQDKLVPPEKSLAEQRAAQLGRTIERLEHASLLFASANCFEQKGRSDLLIVEAFWLNNNRQRAVEKATAIKKYAQETGLVDICKRANDIIDGKSPFEEFEKLPSIVDLNKD